jgi:hypothetical protein
MDSSHVITELWGTFFGLPLWKPSLQQKLAKHYTVQASISWGQCRPSFWDRGSLMDFCVWIYWTMIKSETTKSATKSTFIMQIHWREKRPACSQRFPVISRQFRSGIWRSGKWRVTQPTVLCLHWLTGHRNESNVTTNFRSFPVHMQIAVWLERHALLHAHASCGHLQ